MINGLYVFIAISCIRLRLYYKHPYSGEKSIDGCYNRFCYLKERRSQKYRKRILEFFNVMKNVKDKTRKFLEFQGFKKLLGFFEILVIF